MKKINIETGIVNSLVRALVKFLLYMGVVYMLWNGAAHLIGAASLPVHLAVLLVIVGYIWDALNDGGNDDR